MELNAVTKSVGDIFSVNKKYLVPRFQRQYSWTKEEVEALWEDITHQIKFSRLELTNEEYFIGCIVLVGEDSKTECHIVDGQQRLTTLTILIRAIVERLRELDDTAAASALYGNYIEGTDNDGKKYFKLDSESPKPYFQNEIQAFDKAGLNEAITDEEELLLATYNMFLKKLKGFSIHNLGELESIRALRAQVLHYLKFILVTAKHEDDAYTIFETLNARGLSLTSVDLIKNWIFKNNKSTHPHDNAKEIWHGLRKKISEFSDLGTFFRHYWNSKYAFTSDDRLYKSFNELQKAGKIAEAKLFLLELNDAAERYRKIGAPKDNDWKTQKEKAVVRHLILISQYKVTQVRPFLLALMECREKKYVDETNFVKTIRSLENFHFVFSNICKERASGLDGTYTRAAKSLYTAGDKKSEVKKVILDLCSSLADKTPKLQRITEAISSLSFVDGNETNKKTIQTIFMKIEQFLIDTTELKVGNFSLEHIEDQSTGNSWVGGIGNMIPLDEKLNSGIRRSASFKDKKNSYKKSSFKTVDRFLEMNPQDTWDAFRAQIWLLEIATLLQKATT